jgi:hypothetical protein
MIGPIPGQVCSTAPTWRMALTMNPVSEFQARYQHLSNFELQSIALKQSATLPHEALRALRREMDRRGLPPSLRRGIETQVSQWTKDDLATFIEQYRHRPCPRCGVQGKTLNGVLGAVARSFIVTSTVRTKLVFGCSSCIRTELGHLSKQSLLFGWWGIPWGPAYTVRALAVNAKAKKAVASTEPTPELWDYIASHVGEIVADTRSSYRTDQ